MSRENSQASLDDLIALNEEISALVKAGVPLGPGLSLAGGELSGCLASLMSRLATRLNQGASLPEALEDEKASLPRLYKTVVEAGLKAGRLPAALEGLATYARSLAELRSTIGLALMYPLMVVLIAYSLFVALTVGLAPRFQDALRDMRLPTSLAVSWLAQLGDNAIYWAPALPLLILIGLLAWRITGNARSLDPSRIGAGLGWVPWMRGLLKQGRAALYSDLLALLLESRVPMPDAMRLAASTIRRKAPPAKSPADQPDDPGLLPPADLPPMIRWILSTSHDQERLVRSLKQAAALYHQRALDRGDMIRAILPAALTILIGGGAALLYGLTLFVPFATLLEELAN